MSEGYRFHAFIAYAKPDADYADKLYLLLTGIGYRIFLDRQTLTPGQNWTVEIPRAQSSSLVTVVLISNRSDAAYFEKEEIASAIQLTRAQRHRVVPVYLNGEIIDEDRVPYGLRQLQSIVCDVTTSPLLVAQRIESVLQASRHLEEWRHDIDSLTVVIVTGCHHFAEIYDRPTAYDLKEEIDRQERSLGKNILGSVVMGDIWFQQQSGISGHSNVISLGSPAINNLTHIIVDNAKTIRIGPDEKWRIERDSNRWALFGIRGDDTRAAVASFKQNDLVPFLKAIW